MKKGSAFARTARRLRSFPVLAAVLAVVLPVATIALSATPAAADVVDQYAVQSPTNVPGGDPGGATYGPDGNVWFTDLQNNAIGKVTPSGVVTEYPVTTANAGVADIALGSDNNLWFTEATANQIGMIDPKSPSTVTEYPIPTAASGAYGIAAGSDGDLWFAESNSGKVAHFSPSAPTSIIETAIPSCTGCAPLTIAAGPDKNVWFTEEFANKIGRINPKTLKISQFKAGPKLGRPGLGSPQTILSGANGDVWFLDFVNESGTDLLQGINTSGVIVTTQTFLTQDGCCSAVTSGQTGDLWLPETQPSNAVLQLDSSGNFIASDPIPSAPAEVGGMTMGTDNNIWMADDGPGTVTSTTGNMDVIAIPHPNIDNVYYLPNRFFIPNEATLGQQGDTVNWIGLNPKNDSITDSSGMGLFGSQDSLNTINSTYQFSFDAAGTYRFRGGAGGTGKVAVPLVVQLAVGATNVANVTWSSAAPPGGFAFLVQEKEPGATSWTNWQVGTTATSGSISPASGGYIGPGTYKFRSLIMNTANGTASGFSPVGSITLS